jgi:SNF2 family DNA or RNA helicase
MSTTLWPHQRRAVDFALPLSGAGLFLEMRCGKSLCAIELLRRWGSPLTLICCPKSVRSTWLGQFERHAPGEFMPVLLEGSTAKKVQQIKDVRSHNKKPLCLITNYESIWREPLDKLLMTMGLTAVINDESHRIKSVGGVASRFLSKLGPKVRRRLNLTGTPLHHSFLDIYGQYRFLDPKIFGYSFVRFRNEYAIMGGYEGRQVLGMKQDMIDRFHERMYSIAYRCTAAEVFDDLPAQSDEDITFALSPAAMKIYKELDKEFIAYVNDCEYTVNNALTKLLRLAQLCGGTVALEGQDPVSIDHAKADTMADLLEDIGDEPAVVFCRFHADLDAVKASCKKLQLACGELSGRADDLLAFQAGRFQVIACQIKSGGSGVDFSRARLCFFYSIGESLGDYQQARARLLGPDQKRPVTFFHLLAEKTVDQKIIKAIRKNANITKFIVDDMRGIT